MRIDVVFDTVCPWCYIGTRRLRRALAKRPHVRAEIRWRPFLLNPEMPPEGMDRKTHLERKFGSAHRVQRVFGAVLAAAGSEGMTLDLDAIGRTPSSVASHRLIRFAEREPCRDDLVEAIFAAYFAQGRDIGDPAVLEQIGAAHGLPAEPLRAYIGTIEAQDGLTGNARAHRLGVNGVPCFIFDDRYAIAGAQEPDILARMLDLAAEGRVEVLS
ncbi:MAG: DsbA family oxidoreductase [Alphaproteobacteria bacterium]|nr:DsbA family oxidoreductase [Alphaproteobacteria bacterium]